MKIRILIIITKTNETMISMTIIIIIIIIITTNILIQIIFQIKTIMEIAVVMDNCLNCVPKTKIMLTITILILITNLKTIIKIKMQALIK